MKSSPNLSALIERFFTERLMRQRQVSQHTIASYRDTFRLLLGFVQARLRKPPSSLDLRDLDAALISAFLEELEKGRSVSARTRNLRLTAIRSFFLPLHRIRGARVQRSNPARTGDTEQAT
jgi:site-specific recombinase XerD